MLKGIDVSEWQGSLNYGDLKNAFDFVIARSSFGTSRADNNFAANRDGLRSTSQLHGFYHYAYPEYNSPQAEADFCATILGQLQANEIIALDFEESYNGDPVQWCLQWLQEFEKVTGYKPLLYINLAMVQAHDWSPVIKNNNGLWLADWDGSQTSLPADQWPVTAMKQYTDSVTFDGKTVDGDVFEGDASVFDAYGYKPSSNTGTANMFKLPSGAQVDLNNTSSMKVCATTWDEVVNSHQFVPIADWNAIAADLGLPAGATKDAVDAAIKALQKAKTDSDTVAQQATATVQSLNGTIGELQGQLKTANTALEQAQTQHETDQETIKKLQDGALDPTSGLTYEALYNQQTKDYNADKIAWAAQFKTDVASFSQLKTSTLYGTPTGTIFSYWIQRITGQAKQNVMPPLTPEDFKYADSVLMPPSTTQGQAQRTKN